MSKDQNPSDKACDAYFDNPYAATSGSHYSDRVTFYAGFQAGAASRDAEIQRLQFALADSEALELGTAERCDQLSAQINMLREALSSAENALDESRDYPVTYDEVITALITTPEQSLAEYRNKVIEAIVNEFSRHVGGDGEFWLHELQDFAMKEQP